MRLEKFDPQRVGTVAVRAQKYDPQLQRRNGKEYIQDAGR